MAAFAPRRMQRWLRLAPLIVCFAAGPSGAFAANASLICEPAPGIQFVGEAIGYRTRAEAEAIVRARCRDAARKFFAREARPHRPPPARAQVKPLTKPAPQAAAALPEEACRRYPNLC